MTRATPHESLSAPVELIATTEPADHAQLLERMTDAFIALDRNWNIVYMNAAAQRLGVRPSRSAIGRSHWDEWPMTVGSEVERQYRHAMATQRPVFFEHHYLGPGRDYWHQINAYPDPTGLSIFFRDITEQKRAADLSALLARAGTEFAAARDQGSTLRLVAQMALPHLGDWSIVYLTDATGHVTMVVVSTINPDQQTMLTSVAKHIASAALDPRLPFVHATRSGEPSVVAVTDAFYTQMADMLVLPGLLRQLAPRSLLTVPLVARGHAEGAMVLGAGDLSASTQQGDHALRAAREIGVLAALALDNARLHEAERQARLEAEKAQLVAEQANRSKADFLGTMSHELRTPLNAIAGYVELLQLGVHGALSGEQQRDLERIARNQRHVTNLLSDVLNFARLEAGRVQFECRRVQVAALLHDLEGLVPPGLVGRKDDLRIRPCGDALSIWADPDRTMQVLLNLVVNALKHTPDHTRVEVLCDESPATAHLPFVAIRVRDEGQGIPPEKLDAIFEPFIQATRRKAGSREGLGLGLAIARDLARGMGGDLTVESQIDRGSTFTLTLPRREVVAERR